MPWFAFQVGSVGLSSSNDAKSPSEVNAESSTYLQPDAPPSFGRVSINASLIFAIVCSQTLPDRS
ncbi:MAG TPA: hypothetical protein P5052_03650 [Candidatus Paceibacterota bacterium]|nr:hypothetical protein [Candidatus Paceibacterota bacterium]HRZ29817.1 hypothetical protein [Candidatus Paceibacterota bacterium]